MLFCVAKAQSWRGRDGKKGETPRSEMVRGNCTSGERLRARRTEGRVRGESEEDMRGARAR